LLIVLRNLVVVLLDVVPEAPIIDATGVFEGGNSMNILGTPEGVPKAASDGVTEGNSEGLAEGDRDGGVEGDSEGLAETARDGGAEGDSDGDVEGESVGNSVGRGPGTFVDSHGYV